MRRLLWARCRAATVRPLEAPRRPVLVDEPGAELLPEGRDAAAGLSPVPEPARRRRDDQAAAEPGALWFRTPSSPQSRVSVRRTSAQAASASRHRSAAAFAAPTNQEAGAHLHQRACAAPTNQEAQATFVSAHAQLPPISRPGLPSQPAHIFHHSESHGPPSQLTPIRRLGSAFISEHMQLHQSEGRSPSAFISEHAQLPPIRRLALPVGTAGSRDTSSCAGTWPPGLRSALSSALPCPGDPVLSGPSSWWQDGHSLTSHVQVHQARVSPSGQIAGVNHS